MSVFLPMNRPAAEKVNVLALDTSPLLALRRAHPFDSTSFKAALSSIVLPEGTRPVAALASLTSRPPYRVLSGCIPLAEGAFADAVIAAKLRDLSSRLILLEDTDNLFLAESSLSHVHSPSCYFRRRILRPNEMIYGKQVTGLHVIHNKAGNTLQSTPGLGNGIVH